MFNNPDHLADLFDKYPPVEFKELGIPPHSIVHRTYPLPKKGAFLNRSKVLERYAMKARLHSYENYAPPKGAKITLFTWAVPSGLGDLALQYHTKQILMEAFPDNPIDTVSLVERSVNVPQAFNESVIRYNHPNIPKLTPDALEKLKASHLVIQMPTAYPHTDWLKEALLPTRHLHIGEYGFIDSETFHPESESVCMGLHPLEKGIITLPQKQLSRRRNVFVAYLITEEGHGKYLHAMLEHKKKENEDLHLTIFSIKRLLPALQKEDWKGYGLKEIVISDHEHTSTLPLAASGKRLIISLASGLSPEQMVDLMASSEDFVGCRGNASFSEASSTNGLFFYDVHEHTKPFFMDLLDLAKTHLYPFPSLHEYLELMLSQDSNRTVGQKLGALISDASLHYGMEKLHELLRSVYSFNPTLIQLVSRECLFYEKPELAVSHAEHDAKFYNEEINLVDWIKQH